MVVVYDRQQRPETLLRKFVRISGRRFPGSTRSADTRGSAQFWGKISFCVPSGSDMNERMITHVSGRMTDEARKNMSTA